jgi:hypothetical protein
MSVPSPEADKTAQTSRHVSASQVLDNQISSPAINLTPFVDANGNGNSISSQSAPRSLSMGSAANLQNHGQDSPVMNETLSVIQEHISDMNTPRHSGLGERHATNDSGSEYSSHLDHRMSYINGEETDEEEENMHSEAEVGSWNAAQVAEYLTSVGVEAKHCEVFQEQEITGDVLLGMDQTSVFLKEFELGSVGRRLKTWQKIKALQDEAKGTPPGTRRTTQTYGSDAGSDFIDTNRSRSDTTGTVLPRIPSLMERPGSRQTNTRYSQQPGLRQDSNIINSPKSPIHARPENRRPSAASIRDLHHSRRNSANDFGTTFNTNTPAGSSDSPTIEVSHKKQPSFDRNWTMGTQPSSFAPLSPSGSKTLVPSTEDDSDPGVNLTTPFEFDRGYFSGGDVDGRSRNVLRKKGSTSHSRNSSYTDEQRLRSATTNSRHSRFGSVDSFQQPQPSSASQKYYGMALGRRRAPSADIPKPMPPPKDAPSPTVTKLDGFARATDSPKSAKSSGWLTPGTPASATAPRGLSFRAISDAVTGTEKSHVTSPNDDVPSPVTNDSSIKSPSRAGSSTTSGGPSFDLDSNPSKSPSLMGPPPSKTPRKKTKKETSAYTRGLEKKTPQEQMVGCDYSGWMKKKSTNLMTTWKPRLFILKGRRLSYYYSEDDTEEKGLIDISFHRVLPADNDRLTGLHATLTGATTSPTSPSNSHTPTIASAEAAAEPQSTLSKGTDSMFIFKLVPPRAGLSRAVNFTKPTVHYFAVPNISLGRLWMAALMKATIDRDDTKPITTTYQQKTISLAKARAMRHRPPALMNLDEKVEEEPKKTPAVDTSGLHIRGIIFDKDLQEGDSGVSGLSKLDISHLQDGNSNGIKSPLETDGQPQTA